MKKLLLLTAMSLNCLGLQVSFDASKLDQKFYGSYYQDLNMKSCSINGVVYTTHSAYTIPNSEKNFKLVSEFITRDYKAFSEKYATNGVCEFTFITDLIKQDGTKTSCSIKLDSEKLNMEPNITLPNDEFCK